MRHNFLCNQDMARSTCHLICLNWSYPSLVFCSNFSHLCRLKEIFFVLAVYLKALPPQHYSLQVKKI
ncbi:hypothetical protein NEOC65_002063 [Neochlamydia sp. AcF65]|nr:hypothetical protein [Neochlamydia sp. AcF65]MBS4169502.1 hypothetical protein [Neochlamydia sp. AcF95]NGY94275.1 hypothetical protein [Neochlamydia sp. AcF84]